MRALVVSDENGMTKATPEFPSRPYRTLMLVEQDEHPLQSMTKLSIELEDPVAPLSKGANLAGQVVTAAITKITQRDRTKELVFGGKLLKVEGFMEFKAAKAA